MLNLIKKVKETFSKDKIRREKLLKIISPHIKDWTTYADIEDLVKQEAPEMYEWGDWRCKPLSLKLMGDLNTLESDRHLIENHHYRKTPNDFCTLAYKLHNFSLGLNNEKVVKAKLKYIGEI